MSVGVGFGLELEELFAESTDVDGEGTIGRGPRGKRLWEKVVVRSGNRGGADGIVGGSGCCDCG